MSDHKPIKEEDHVLAGEYVLGLLQQSERLAFERRLAEEPGLADEVRQWNENFVGFAEAIAPAEPPAQTWKSVERRLFAQSSSTSSPSLWSNLAFWRSLAIASIVGVVVLGAWNLRPSPTVAPTTLIIAQVTGEAAKLKLAVLYDAESGELRLNRVAGVPTTGRSQELWLIAGNEAPVSLGVLPNLGSFGIKLPEHLRTKLIGSVLAVSDEPPGGSPTGAPTGAVLATGELTKV